MVKYGDGNMTPDSAQRIAEGQNLDIRLLLRKYESVLEAQRLAIAERRHRILTGEDACEAELERVVTLRTIDDLWADYLAAVSDLRTGTVWTSLGGSNPFTSYITRIHAMFQELEQAIAEEVPVRLAQASAAGADPRQRGATWTYLTTDEPFGRMSERFARGLRRMLSHK
jgi:preprotein translocase subunit SecA